MSGTQVLDASIVAASLLDEPLSGLVDALLAEAEDPIAPDYVDTECANAIWKRHMRTELNAEEAVLLLLGLERFAINLHDTGSLLPPALLIAMRTGHAVYDCIYIALAAQEDAELVTADVRQAEAAREVGVRVRVLGAAE